MVLENIMRLTSIRPSVARTMIDRPDRNIGCEKSSVFSRSAVMEMAAIPAAFFEVFTASSSAGSVSYRSKRVFNPSSSEIARHRSMLKPENCPPSPATTNGATSRVATTISSFFCPFGRKEAQRKMPQKLR